MIAFVICYGIWQLIFGINKSIDVLNQPHNLDKKDAVGLNNKQIIF
jgi:hypothetical protein